MEGLYGTLREYPFMHWIEMKAFNRWRPHSFNCAVRFHYRDRELFPKTNIITLFLAQRCI